MGNYIRSACSLAVLLSLAALTGCGVYSASATIRIIAAQMSVAVQDTTQLKAVITNPQGQVEDVTAKVDWRSSDAKIAKVSSTGVLTALSPGTVRVTATTTNSYGTISMSVGKAATRTLVSISLTPLSPSVEIGSNEQYTATALYSDKATANVTGSVRWTVTPANVAKISAAGLLTAVGPGTYTVSAASGTTVATAKGTVTSGGSDTSGTFPIPVYTGVDLSRFPSLNVATYAASGSAASLTCTGSAGSNQLSCTGLSDFAPGQGIRIVGGGDPSAEAAITTQPIITLQGSNGAGMHTFCYVVDTVDPLGGISAPSPQACVTNQPELSVKTTYNLLTTTTSTVGPSPCFLWYVSEDGGPFQLLNVAKFTSDAHDMGQRIGSRGGWPDHLAPGNPDISKHQDLFSTVQSVNGGRITLADPLTNSVQNSLVDHDDTQAIENTILAAVKNGGGTIVLGAGTFNVRRPAFAYVVNHSFAYPPYTTKLAWDPYWAAFNYLYIPNGAAGNINFQGAGRATTLVTPPDHGGVASLLAVGRQQRQGAIDTPILSMEEVPKGATQITLTNPSAAAILAPGDDIFIYCGSYYQQPVIDTTPIPDMNHYSELNTVKSISGNVITLAYPTSKRYGDDGGSSWGLTKLPVTPHNIEMQHLNISTSEPITSIGDVIGMLVNDVQIQGTLSLGAFGGGYKRGMTIENSQWTFGQGTKSWGQEDEYDDFTDLAFLYNQVSGFAAPGSEGPSEMARIYATEGTSQVLFLGNSFDHVSLYADQTTEYYVLDNTFVDGVVTAGMAYGAYTQVYDPWVARDRSFLSFASQETFSVDHNSFTITPDFAPTWVIRAGDFRSGSITNNVINYLGKTPPWFVVGTFNGSVSNNTISVQSATARNIILLVPDLSPITPMSSFNVQGNSTVANIIQANIFVPNPGFSDTAPVCIQNNMLQVKQGANAELAPSILNQKCL